MHIITQNTACFPKEVCDTLVWRPNMYYDLYLNALYMKSLLKKKNSKMTMYNVRRNIIFVTAHFDAVSVRNAPKASA